MISPLISHPLKAIGSQVLEQLLTWVSRLGVIALNTLLLSLLQTSVHILLGLDLEANKLFCLFVW